MCGLERGQCMGLGTVCGFVRPPVLCLRRPVCGLGGPVRGFEWGYMRV